MGTDMIDRGRSVKSRTSRTRPPGPSASNEGRRVQEGRSTKDAAGEVGKSEKTKASATAKRRRRQGSPRASSSPGHRADPGGGNCVGCHKPGRPGLTAASST